MLRWYIAGTILLAAAAISAAASRAVAQTGQGNSPPPAARPDVSEPQEIPGLGSVPGLNEFIRPDGFVLPGGAGYIRRAPDHLGIQINTPDGPFEIIVPRRRARAADQPALPGSDSDAPLFGSGAKTPPNPAGRATPVSGFRDGRDPNHRPSHEFAAGASLVRAKNYNAALRHLDRWIEKRPQDRDLLQLRSLVHFSLGDYSAAYGDALAVLAADDFWNWATLRSMYHSAEEYTAHYRALEGHALAHPNAVEPWFLLAYHNLMLGNADAARRQFERVAGIDPANSAARRLAAQSPAPPLDAHSGSAAVTPSPPRPPVTRGPSAGGDPRAFELGKPGSIQDLEKSGSSLPR